MYRVMNTCHLKKEYVITRRLHLDYDFPSLWNPVTIDLFYAVTDYGWPYMPLLGTASVMVHLSSYNQQLLHNVSSLMSMKCVFVNEYCIRINVLSLVGVTNHNVLTHLNCEG